jgi:type I restriction enzyme S subunit
MIANLQPYREYKDSGLPWLPQVPSHWRVTRSKFLFREVDQRSKTGNETRLSMSQKHGLIPSSQIEEKRLVSASNVGGKLCEPGDLVLNRLKAHLGVIAVSPTHGLVSPDYTVLRPIGNVYHRFFCEVYRSPYCGQELRTRAKGIVEGFWRLYTNDFYDIRVCVPPSEEQAAVVRFLDYANGRLERAIRAKRKVISLLHEQKQAIIHRAVTRGLDPNAPLKPSAIPWLGDIPKHWETPMNGRIFRENIRPHEDKNEPPLSLSQRDGLIKTEHMQERSLKTSTYDNWKVTVPGDLVVNRFKAHLGVFFASNLRGIVSFHYAVFEPQRRMNTKYFELLYHTTPYRTIYAGRSNGMTVGLQNLSNQNFYAVRAVVPPIEEQNAIVEECEVATRDQDLIIARLNREIELLREYRTRLVADVVTGKLDVTEAVRNLPVESVGNEIEPDAEDFADSDSEDDEP